MTFSFWFTLTSFGTGSGQEYRIDVGFRETYGCPTVMIGRKVSSSAYRGLWTTVVSTGPVPTWSSTIGVSSSGPVSGTSRPRHPLLNEVSTYTFTGALDTTRSWGLRFETKRPTQTDQDCTPRLLFGVSCYLTLRHNLQNRILEPCYSDYLVRSSRPGKGWVLQICEKKSPSLSIDLSL